MDRGEYGEILYGCRVEGKKIIPRKPLSDAALKEFGDQLRADVLTYNVPHFKVIGVKVINNKMDDYLKKVSGISQSYAGLLGSTRDVVYADGGGVAFPNVSEERDINKEYNRDYAFMTNIDNDVQTDNGSLVLVGKGNKLAAQSLISNVPIIKFTGSCVNTTVYFMLYRGTGVIEFNQVGKKLSMYHRDGMSFVSCYRNVMINFVPMRQVYDLCNAFTIKLWMPGDTAVNLRYTKAVNEPVLQKIFNEFGGDILASNSEV